MAEIGLIASIIGVAGAGAKISITLPQIASTIGLAANELRLIAADTNALSLVLTNLSKTLREKRTAAQEGEQIAGAVLLMCRTVIDDTNELIRHLEPLVKGTVRAPKVALLPITWLFQKSKFATHRQSLEALKSTLCLLVTTMSFAAAVEVKTDEESKEFLRVQVECAKAEINADCNGTGNVVELLQHVAMIPTTRNIQSSEPLLIQGPRAITPKSTPAPAASDKSSAIDESEDFEKDEEDKRTPDQKSVSDATTSTELTLFTKEETENDGRELEEEYGNISPDNIMSLVEISLLQRRVLRYTDVVLRPRSSEGEETKTHHRPPITSTSPGNIRGENLQVPQTAPKAPGNSHDGFAAGSKDSDFRGPMVEPGGS